MAVVSPQIDTETAAAEPAPRARVHLGYLDGMRALAALYVMLHHCALEVWPYYNAGFHLPPPLQHHVLSVFLFGHYAVTVFIAISGFCLMLPVVQGDGTLRGGALNFFKKRARRILPPYYFAMALSLLLIAVAIGHKTGTHWDYSVPVTTHGVISHLLLLQDIFAPANINHVFWSIAVEWQIYFLFPLLVLLWRRWGGGWTTLGAAAVSMVAAHLVKFTILAGLTPQYFAVFAVGMLGAAVANSRDEPWLTLRGKANWPLVGLASLTVGVACIHFRRDVVADYFIGLAAVALMVMASRGPGLLRSALSCKPLAFVGGFSYSLYLVHAPLIQLIWQYALHPLHLGDMATFALLASVGGPLIVAGAYLFYLACERPFLTRQPKAPAELTPAQS